MTWNPRAATCLLIPLVVLLGPAVSPGEETPLEKDPVLLALDAKIGQFFKGVSMGETQNAYQQLLAGSRLIKQDKALQDLTEKTQQLQKKYGRYCGFEQIAAKRVGKDLVLFRYLYKCKDFPVAWYFTFYGASAPGEIPAEENSWRVITVRFDTELELLLSGDSQRAR
jgi:hypothetical protein